MKKFDNVHAVIGYEVIALRKEESTLMVFPFFSDRIFGLRQRIFLSNLIVFPKRKNQDMYFKKRRLF